jgi:arylsulfatase A-like enzyme
VTRLALALLLPLAFAPGCSRQRSAALADVPATSTSTPEGPPATPGPQRPVMVDMTRAVGDCSFGHDGVLVDIGDSTKRANLHPGSLRPGPEEWVERQGATWLRVRSRVLVTTFYWPEFANDRPDAGIYVQARVVGVAARSVSVAIDGRNVGSLSLGKGETERLVARPASPLALATGGHELALHFAGGARGAGEALAEVEWVHVGTGDPTEPYAAPTRGDVLVDASVGGRSLPALSLRAPGFARCSGFVPADATLEAWLATAGGGDADVEARIIRDRRPPIVLGTAHIMGGGANWASWSLPVAGLAGNGELASIELLAKGASKGTRLLFGQPRVVGTAALPAPSSPGARGVLLVVLGSTSAKALSPWGGPHAATAIASLAASGTLGMANRAPSSLGNAVVASMLTGLPPFEHGLDDPDRSLAEEVTTLQQACREGGISTAMFTADPTTGAAFGFSRGWDTFSAHDPLEDVPATRVFDEAATWIGAHAAERFFVLVHARGGHPPWDATADELKEMPPVGYVGMIDPRRAAEALAKVRRHPARFKEDDRVRAWALYDHALDAHDVALGQLLAALQAAGRDRDTLVLVTGDVAANETTGVPFAEYDTLDEPALATPLVVRWPRGSTLAGRRIESATSAVDLGRTVLDALGLAAPTAFQGVDLGALAQQGLFAGQRPLAATRAERFSVRWGSYVLAGSHGHEARMCDLSLDPACIADVRGTSPLALESIRRFATDALSTKAATKRLRLRPTLDEHTMAALVRWGKTNESDE